MRELLEQEFFPFVVKPGRYAGGEPGQVVKSPEGRLKYLHAYPDKYEIGQSYVGLQTLYHIVNKDDRFLCERSFAPDRDAEELMREKSIPLFSLESRRPASEFDVIGFTLVSEIVFTNMLAMIDLAGLPLRACERTNKHPLVIAGGPAVYNPEAIAPFVDLFFIGDAEEGLPEMLTLLHEHPEWTRDEKLEQLVGQIESVYVPKFYDSNRQPTVDFAPPQINARQLTKLDTAFYPEQPLVPLIEVVQNHLSIEIMRGCPHRCGFCLAESIYRPVRPREKNDIINQITRQLDHTGYSEVTLLSLSSSDYPHIEQLVQSLATKLANKRVSLDMPSLRPGTVTPELIGALAKVRSGGLTIAPEAGSERLRSFIGKNFPDEAIFDTARIAFDKGFRSLKLYFMVGLPTETDEDLSAIADIANRIREIGHEFEGKKNITVRLAMFIPQSHTPFQWDEAAEEREVFRRIKLVRKHIRGSNIQVKYHDTRESILSCALVRGGREIADVIEAAFREGARFDGWSDEFDFERWQSAFSKCDILLEEYLKPMPYSRSLPWSHIVRQSTSEQLQAERNKTSKSIRDYTPRYRPTQKTDDVESTMAFGRGKRKVVSRSQTVAPTKNRVRLRWGKSATYRYMSHLDNLRLIERAIRRADVPVAYSQGNNPSMKLSFGPPLPLGFTSDAELVDITLESNLMTYMIDNLKSVLPVGIDIHDARVVYGGSTSLSSALNRATYRVPVHLWTEGGKLQDQISTLLNQESLTVEREGKNGIKIVDIRPGLYEIRADNDNLEMTLGLGEGVFVRPSELLKQLSDGLNGEVAAVPIHRTRLFRVDETGQEIDPMDIC